MTRLTNPKISIITCFLNTERYLAEAVESVLAQEYTNWELLLIDDGSTDNSTELAKKFAAQYPGKIVYLEHEGHINRGSSASRNAGIEKASGELIAFLDADDVWRPQLLSHLLALLQEHRVAMVCEATLYWYSWNQDKKDWLVQIGTSQDQTFLPPRLMTELYPLRNRHAPCICGILIKKDILQKWGSWDESFTGMYDDQAFLTKIYLHEKVYISSSCNNLYRQHPDSMVKTSWRTNFKDVRLQYLEWLEQYLQQENINHPEINRLLADALMPYRRPMLYFFKQRLPQEGKNILSKIKRKARAKAKAIGINARA
ncbi:glycosyltransferase family 2 protein [Cesiribacter sp. SM1]|uniref:glycosyltransferase family 2 protein n=1 Tax=Cesiribacter sp. SM1 TaxID=2861196 RepID=UPI001CD2D4B8|nr:glycosyltransferase family 2 protein [Cesiribacter sp. SM1]